MSQGIRPLLAVIVTGAAFSASSQQDAEHIQHPPAAASAPSFATASTQPITPQAGMPTGLSMPPMQQGMQQHTATMQTLHAQPAAAPTAAEHAALMADHLKTMQAGVEMMQRMMTVLMRHAPAAAPHRTWR